MKKISRRSFLKVSGTMAAAGALAACGGSSSTSTAASSEAAPSVEAKAVDGLPDMSKETLNFSSDKVGSGSYNMIVAMSKVLEKAGGFQTVNVNPDSPGGMGAPYLFASGNTDLAFINGAPAKWAMEEGTLGKPATSGYAAVIGGLTAVCYINCVSNAFLQKYNVSTIEEIFEQKLPLRIGCSAKGSMDAEGAYLLLEYFGVTEDDLKSWGGSITNQGGDANADAIADGQIDFYIDHTSSASSTMAQIATSVDVTFLQWGDDLCSWFVSEKGFDRIKAIGIIPETDIDGMEGTEAEKWGKLSAAEKEAALYKFDKPVKEKKITQEMRQIAFDNYETTDDHGMVIVGTAVDQQGNPFFKVKNSWDVRPPYDGYYYFSRPFVEYKTLSVMVNKNAIPQEIRTKLGI